MGCQYFIKSVKNTGNQTHFWLIILSPFPLVFVLFLTVLHYFLQKHYMSCHDQDKCWKRMLVLPLSTSLELLNSLTSWKWSSLSGTQLHFLPSPVFLTLCFLHRDEFSQLLLNPRLFCAILCLSTTQWPWEIRII